MLWRNDALEQAGLQLPESDTEIVLTTCLGYAANCLVSSADGAADAVQAVGGRVVAEPFDNQLVLLDLSNGTYTTDGHGSVTGVAGRPASAI